MSSLFDDEVLNVVLNFSNPNQKVLEDANKHAAQLSLALDQVIRKAVSTGKSIATIAEAVNKLGPALNRFKNFNNPQEPASLSIGLAQKMLARYTPARLERMSEIQTQRASQLETSGSSSLRRALENNTKAIQQAANNRLPSTREQLILESVRDLSEDIRTALQQRLGDFSRGGWAKPSINQRTVLRNQASVAADGIGEIFSRYVISAIEGGTTFRTRRPVSSNDYGIRKGSGQSPDVTPGYIGAAAIGLDRRLRIIEEFQRNLALANKLGDEVNFLRTYAEQSKFQERSQQSRGRGLQNKLGIRPGDELALATMAGVNTRLKTQREVASGFYDPNAAFRSSQSSQDLNVRNNRDIIMSKMLAQSWAQPTGKFSSSEIDEFIKKHQGDPGVGSIKTAAQMAATVGKGDHRFNQLSDILLAGQAVGKQLRNQRLVEESRRVSGDADIFSQKRPARKISDAIRAMADFGKASAITSILPFTSAGGIGGGSFASIFNFLRSRRKVQEAPPEEDLRASMRFDALHSKLSRLAEAVESTTKSFERYRDVAAPLRRENARAAFENRDLAITRGLTMADMSASSQLARVENRRFRSQQSTQKAMTDAALSLDSKTRTLGFNLIEAEIAHEEAVIAQEGRRKKLQNSKAFKDGALTKADIEAQVSAPVKRANRRLTLAQYNNDAAQMVDPEKIEELRKNTAVSLATQRYGNNSAFTGKRNEYAGRVYDLLAGPTLAQQAADKGKQLHAMQLQREKEFDQEKTQIESRRDLAQKRADQAREANANKLGSTLIKIEQDVAKKGEQVVQVRSAAERKAAEARIAYTKRERIIAGGGGGGVGGTRTPGSGGGGASDDFASRGALGWGLGAAGLAAYGSVLKEVIKDTVIYAARTETLQLVTDQMARVNGLNTEQVGAQIERNKQLNITTQEAHTTVQKMIFAQLDVAKATNLARTSQDAAILANVNSSEALDKIILGIVTGQTRVLHNMNLQVSMLQVLKELRASKRATGDKSEPTELEKRQAMLNKVLLEGAKIMGTYERAMLTAGKQFNSLQREIQETQNAVGEQFLPEFGRAVSVMSSGLRVMRENGDATAKFASGLVSLGAAASTIGSLSFMKWLMTAPAVPPWAKLLGAGVGVLTYRLMNQDNAEAMSTTATEQLNNVQTSIAKLRKERAKLFSAGDKSDPNWKNSWEQNTVALQSLTNAQVEIQRNLTEKLADEYEVRLKDLDDYISAMQGKRGALVQALAVVTGAPDEDIFTRIGKSLPFMGTTGPEDIESAKKRREGFTVSTIPGISHDDIKKEAALRKANRERLVNLTPTLLNEEKLEVRSIIAQIQQAESELVKLDDKFSETGLIGLKARKSMGSPREKVELDFQYQVAQVNKLTGSFVELKKKAEEGDIAAKSKLDEVAKSLGGGSFEVGEKKINDFLMRRNDIIAEAANNRDIEASKITRQTNAQIAQIREQTILSGIKTQAIVGNYESEIAAIQKTFDVRQNTNKRVLALTNDIDAYKKKVAQDEVDRELALMELEDRRVKARLRRAEDITRATGSFNAGRILDSPIDARDAIIKAYGEEFKATKAITDEEQRRDERLRLVLKLRQDLVKAAQDEARLSAELATATFESQQEVATEVDRITSSKGRTNAQRNLDEIERARVRALATAENRYNNLVGVTPSGGQAGLRQERDIAKMKADADATVSIIKELDQQVEAARGRLGDYYKQQFQRVERINELQATNLTDEANAAFNTHLERLSYIEKEYEAKGKTPQAEKEKAQEIQEAEFDQLQKLLAIRKREIEGIKNAAGSVFDALTRDGGGGIKELAMGQLRVTGRQIFQNVAGEAFGSARQVIGNIIPGQNTVDSNGKRRSTLLGRVLSGTLLSPSNSEDTDKLLAKVTMDNTSAERDLATAISSLDAAVRAATGQGPGLGGALGGGLPLSSIPGFSAINSISSAIGGTGLFGGASSTNPTIFHGLPDGESMPTFSTDVVAGKTRSKYQQIMGGFGLGSTGKANILDVFSGSSSVRTGSGTATAMTKAERMGAAAGYAALIGGGTMTAISGFKEGGFGGHLKGVGGVLTAASAIPGPQQPFIMAGAMAAGLISALLPDAREARKKEIEQWTKDNRHIQPIAIDIEMTTDGNVVSYNKFGKSRDTRNAAFPITIQPNQYRDSMADENQEVFLPGRVVDPPQRPAAGGNVYVTMPVSAIDTRDFLSRSRDIVQAVQKEIRLSSDLGLGLQNSIFGAS